MRVFTDKFSTSWVKTNADIFVGNLHKVNCYVWVYGCLKVVMSIAVSVTARMCASKHADTAQPPPGSPRGLALPQRPPFAAISKWGDTSLKWQQWTEGRLFHLDVSLDSASALMTGLPFIQDDGATLEWHSSKWISVWTGREALSRWGESGNLVRTASTMNYSEIETPETVKTKLAHIKVSRLANVLYFFISFVYWDIKNTDVCLWVASPQWMTHLCFGLGFF